MDYNVYLQFLGLVISFPYANMSLDSQASQNLEGFWLMLIIFCLMHVTHTSTLIYHIQFSTIHREIHNEVYSLSAYYVSELIIMVRERRSSVGRNGIIVITFGLQGAWTLIKVLHYGATAFTIVGFEWGGVELFVISTVAFSALSIGNVDNNTSFAVPVWFDSDSAVARTCTCFPPCENNVRREHDSHASRPIRFFNNGVFFFFFIITGSLLSACFEDIQNTFTVVTVYEYLALSISGAYLSLK